MIGWIVAEAVTDRPPSACAVPADTAALGPRPTPTMAAAGYLNSKIIKSANNMKCKLL